MDNKNIGKPLDLSAIEWSLLQHLSSLTDCFYQTDAAVGFIDINTLFQPNKALRFAQNFSRLKMAGYLIIVPMAFNKLTLDTKPLYTLTILGKNVVSNNKTITN